MDIIVELRRLNEITSAIQAAAQVSLEQAFPDNDPPAWAVVIDVLSRLATDELESLEIRLRKPLNRLNNDSDVESV